MVAVVVVVVVVVLLLVTVGGFPGICPGGLITSLSAASGSPFMVNVVETPVFQ